MALPVKDVQCQTLNQLPIKDVASQTDESSSSQSNVVGTIPPFLYIDVPEGPDVILNDVSKTFQDIFD